MNRNSELLLPSRASRRNARETSFEIHVSVRMDAPQTIQYQPDLDAGVTLHDRQIPIPTGMTSLANAVSVTVQVIPPARRR